MVYLSEDALAQIAAQQHRAAIDRERGAKTHRDRRDDALLELRARGWTNQRIADVLDVTEGAIRRMLKDKGQGNGSRGTAEEDRRDHQGG
jgi:DNA-binding NarL/FixJ family response regulator